MGMLFLKILKKMFARRSAIMSECLFLLLLPAVILSHVIVSQYADKSSCRGVKLIA